MGAWGVLASFLMLWEWIFNDQMKPPNSMMQAFVAFVVPDCLLSVMTFAVYMEQLVDGNPLGSPTGSGGRDDGRCRAVAFLQYTFSVCSYFAPVMVSIFTWLKFRAVARGQTSSSISGLAIYALCAAAPLIV